MSFYFSCFLPTEMEMNQKELLVVKEEHDILKKAVAIFSKEQK